MSINDELGKIVAGIPHSHPCTYCDLDYRCQDKQCWGKRSFMCGTCHDWKYSDPESSYRVGSEASEDEPKPDQPGYEDA